MMYTVVEDEGGYMVAVDERGNTFKLYVEPSDGWYRVYVEEHRCIDCQNNLGCEYDDSGDLMVACNVRRTAWARTRGAPPYVRRRDIAGLKFLSAYERCPCPYFNNLGWRHDTEELEPEFRNF